MSVAAVYACVRILSESVASLPLMLYRRTANGREVARNHRLYRLMHDAPNEEQTSFEFLEFKMGCLAMRGNSYNWLELGNDNVVRSIQPLRPQFMQLDRDSRGRLVFDYQEPGAARVYEREEIWYSHGFSMDGVQGASPLSLHREGIGYALTLSQHGARLFANGAQVPATIEIPGEWSDAAFDRFKADFNEKHGGALNAGKPLILEGGAKFNSIGLSSVDAEYIASRKFQISEIARMFRVPPHMLADLERATFSNIEHQSLEFIRDTLRPWLRRIEQSANRDLLSEAERRLYFFEFKIDALLRGDQKSRYDAYHTAIADGWMSRNEVRRLENLNPVDGLDEYLVPLNMAKADEANTVENALDREARALMAERARLSDSEFSAWAKDYYRRLAARLKRDGWNEIDADLYAEAHLYEVLEHGPEAAIENWRSGTWTRF